MEDSHDCQLDGTRWGWAARCHSLASRAWLRPEVKREMALGDPHRRREEDPYTGYWTRVAPTQVVVHRSRFECDLNRSREQAVYRQPADCWGLEVWKRPPSDQMVSRSLTLHDRFYQQFRGLLEEKLASQPLLLVLDLHSYNHRREGPDQPSAPACENPQINIGTGSLDRVRWGPLVDCFIRGLRQAEGPHGGWDVRENVRFQGGYFPRWIHATFPDRVCALAIEVKKFFMDEWTGAVDQQSLEAVAAALEQAVQALPVPLILASSSFDRRTSNELPDPARWLGISLSESTDKVDWIRVPRSPETDAGDECL